MKTKFRMQAEPTAPPNLNLTPLPSGNTAQPDRTGRAAEPTQSQPDAPAER